MFAKAAFTFADSIKNKTIEYGVLTCVKNHLFDYINPFTSISNLKIETSMKKHCTNLINPNSSL